jgi:hypothetical protein
LRWQEHGPAALPLPPPPPPARFPLSVSADRRRLLDAGGRPFLVQGDAAWSLIANLVFEDVVTYLDDRRAKGFNTLIVNLVEHRFSVDPPRDRYGHEPFGDPTDMATPQEAYFDHAARVLEACRDRGFAVVLCPAYLGHRQLAQGGMSPHAEGWYEEVVATGTDGCRRYGEYLGKRFGHLGNLIWCLGGDWEPGDARAGLDALARGIRAGGTRSLFTAHVRPETSPVDAFAAPDWLDLNLTYTYGIVHQALLRDWRREPPWPFVLIESTYEGEHNASQLQIRRQAYWSVLCGGNGHCMGNNPIWLFWEGWRDALDLPGSLAMARWGDLFRGLPWADLRPDEDRRLVTRGLGEARGLDRVAAALTPDGSVAVAYLPVARPVEVDTDAMADGPIEVAWFEPASGRRASGGFLQHGSRVTLAPPFVEDAVLTLAAGSWPNLDTG